MHFSNKKIFEQKIIPAIKRQHPRHTFRDLFMRLELYFPGELVVSLQFLEYQPGPSSFLTLFWIGPCFAEGVGLQNFFFCTIFGGVT